MNCCTSSVEIYRKQCKSRLGIRCFCFIGKLMNFFQKVGKHISVNIDYLYKLTLTC